MGFRRKITIQRFSGGHVGDDGIYVPGSPDSIAIIASVQPLNINERTQYTQVDASGASTCSLIKLYTNFNLRPAKQANEASEGNEADIVLWLDRKWKVVFVDAYQSGIISHYKAIAQEVEYDAEGQEIVSA